MNNWKSTLIGSLLAVGDVVTQFLSDPTFDWSDPKNYIRPVLLALLGYVVSDAKKSVQIVLLLVGCSFMLPSCAEFPINAKIQTPYGDLMTDAKGGLIIAPRADIIRIPIRSEK
jgi:hypothetical protein